PVSHEYPAAQPESPEQFVVHAGPPHTYGAQLVEPPSTQLPLPSHVSAFCWSPLAHVCEAQTVPRAAFVLPHVPDEHVATSQTPGEGQSFGPLHETHCPVPLHIVPPPSVHAVPPAFGRFDGVPAVQTSSVH